MYVMLRMHTGKYIYKYSFYLRLKCVIRKTVKRFLLRTHTHRVMCCNSCLVNICNTQNVWRAYERKHAPAWTLCSLFLRIVSSAMTLASQTDTDSFFYMSFNLWRCWWGWGWLWWLFLILLLLYIFVTMSNFIINIVQLYHLIRRESFFHPKKY